MGCPDNAICDFSSLNGRTNEQFIDEMKTHFFNHRIVDAHVSKYVWTDTVRGVFSDLKNQNRTLKTFLSDDFYSIFTLNFLEWYEDENRIPYDVFHHQQVLLFAKELAERHILVRKKSRRIDGFSNSVEEFYNAYAKPYNLLIWHFALGGDQPILNLGADFDIISMLHPAFDRILFAGVRGTFAKITGSVPSCVPRDKREGYKYIKTKISYYELLNHVRKWMRKFGAPAITLEAYWKNS
jgi:hypothetical protein